MQSDHPAIEPPPALVRLEPGIPADFSLRPNSDPDRLRRQDCGSSGSEIVICGRRDDGRLRLGDPLAPPPSVIDEAKDAMSLRLGPLEFSPQQVPGFMSTGNGVGVKIQF